MVQILRAQNIDKIPELELIGYRMSKFFTLYSRYYLNIENRIKDIRYFRKWWIKLKEKYCG